MSIPPLSRSILVAFATLAVAACGSDKTSTGTTDALKAVASSVTGPLRAKPDPDAKGIGLTRAALANILTPVDLVTVEKTGAQGVIAKIATNRGVETWSSVDGKTLSMRNGIILATRGLGGDLMSAAVPTASQLMQANSHHQRTHTILDGEDKPVIQRFDCRSARQGAETITVVERPYSTYRVQETCAGDAGGFLNEYWFESGGKLRRSRQMISNSVGIVAIEHLQ